MIVSKEDSVVHEATASLREWHQIWISLYLDNQTELFNKISDIMSTLIDLRAELSAAIQRKLNQESIVEEQQIVQLKSEIIRYLNLGNHSLNLDLVPRDANFRPVDPVEVSPIKLYQLHCEAASIYTASQADSLNTSPSYGFQESSNGVPTYSPRSSSYSSTFDGDTESGQHSSQASFHLQLSVIKHCLASLPPDDLVEVYFTIVHLSNQQGNSNNMPPQIKPLTDKFLLQLQNDEIACGVPTTVFKDVGALNDAYLYVQVYRVGGMTLVDGHKTTFGRQQSGLSQQLVNNQNGSNATLASNKFLSTGLTMGRNLAIIQNSAQSNYRRPFGTTMIPLKEFTRTINPKETLFNIKILAQNESEFSTIGEFYSKRNYSLKNNQNLSSVQMDITIKLLSCSRESLSNILTGTSYCVTDKRGFPDIIMPGDFKNDLYFTLESAEFDKGGKSIAKNIEATISLIDKNGTVIENCISPGSNCDNMTWYRSCIFYHSNTPKWNESIKINVPLSEFDTAHIRIEFRHCSTKDKDKKFLGLSILPLSDENGAIIANNVHELYLYKCDSQVLEDAVNLCKYTSLPYGPSAKLQSNQKPNAQLIFAHNTRELVSVTTFLFSTKLTQNSDLLNLLKWRELIKRDKKEFENALKKITNLDGDEIVKFLQDILDTLFDTFTLYSTSEDDYCALIFKILVHIFLLLDDPKYQHFQPVLDSYVKAHFSATLVYRGLLACVKKCLEYLPVVERHAPIQRCFKSIRYVFQFIVQSKLLLSKATGEQNEELFLNDLSHLFRLFNDMLKKSNAKLIPIQVVFLESFPGALEHLIKVVSHQKLTDLVISLSGSVGFDIAKLPAPLSRAKLLFLKGVASSSLLRNQDIRIQITENFCRHLDFYIRSSEELDLCHQVLRILIVKLHDYHWPSIRRLYQLSVKSQPTIGTVPAHIITVSEIESQIKLYNLRANQLCLSIASLGKELEPFVHITEPLLNLLDQLDCSSDRIMVQKYCTCLLTIMKLMTKVNHDYFRQKRKIDFVKLCNLFRSLRAVYSHDWSLMQLASDAILEHPIEEISKDTKTISEVHAPNRRFSSYLKLLVDFITHPTLQLESFSDTKRNHILHVLGDLRLKFSSQLSRFWSSINSYTGTISDLIPTSIQSILDAALLPNEELQSTLIPIFYDMINAEQDHKSNLRQLERCLVDDVDLFFNMHRGNQQFIDKFGGILRTMIKEKTPAWEQKGLKLIESSTRLMRCLINYRESVEIFDNRYKQMFNLVELLNFYKEQDRTNLHLKYLFKLCDIHLRTNNDIEAAFTLKLYADELKWCNRSLSLLEGYCPEQQEWQRKESLYRKIIHHFAIGKCWEETIPLCKELASFYENFLVDYEKVSATLKQLTQFLDSILVEQRPEREYFRVEFLGSDHPEFVRGKEFVFRGGEYERLYDFINRMKSEFPDAKDLNFTTRQSVPKDGRGQFMVISNVKPVPILQEHLKSTQRNINDKILHFYLHNRLDTFSYDLPIIKNAGILDKPSETDNVRNSWVGRYILKLENQLPCILPWTKVVNQEYIEVSPINHAIESISNMNLELSKLILSYKTEHKKPLSPLTMRLQGVIEASVNGGLSVLINAFLKKNPDDPDKLYESDAALTLRDLMMQQFSILEKGLALHGKFASAEFKPLHDMLVERLQETRQTLLKEVNQAPENNYELLTSQESETSSARNVCDNLSSLSLVDSYAKDEVDSHDMNGNIYGDIDDQTYAKPAANRHNTTSRLMLLDGSRSELSSPTRYYTSSASSSLSTLAVLSNLPVNRSRMSITPSKESQLVKHNLLNDYQSDLCIKAARKLSYDTTGKPGSNILGNDFNRVSSSDADHNDQKAPPLPPRSFIGDKMLLTRNHGRASSGLSSLNSSPNEKLSRWSVIQPVVSTEPPPLPSRDQLSSLQSPLVDTTNQDAARDTQLSAQRASLPSSLPHLIKPTGFSNPTRQSIEPPPLPQRLRSTTPAVANLIQTPSTSVVDTLTTDKS